MKVSLNWIKQYTSVDLGIDELKDRIESQLGAVESVTELNKRYQGPVIVRVVDCQVHPAADRLHVCQIDDGGQTLNVPRTGNGNVQVVCGAPNVHQGMLAVWLPPGTTVPDSIDQSPLIIESREIRGQPSNGMLASPKELALGDNHEGLFEIDAEIKPGQSFTAALEFNDYLFELENKMFTHRPDCFGQLGIAREIAGILGHPFSSPDWYKTVLTNNLAGSSNQLPLEVRNELPELVPRFMAVSLSNLTIKPWSTLLQTYLMRVGIRPTNNVVDITNYLMLLTGQPLHAYDYDKVKALSGSDRATLIIRYPKPGEKLTLLGDKIIEPRSQAIMIATDQQLIGLGGVMGGADTQVDEHTKNIILECASFDMYSIRRTAMTHGLFTDAVTRFTKGQSPLQNDRVLTQALKMLSEAANAQPASEIIDHNQLVQRQWIHPPVPITTGFINSRLGVQLSAENIKQLLENVECSVDQTGDNLTVTAPFWRTDIEVREDVVEEVGRLYGYAKLPLELPKRDLAPSKKDPMLELKAAISQCLSRSGANELLTYSFVHGSLLDKVGQNKTLAWQLANALSPDLQYYRISLTPSLLEKVNPNLRAGYDRFVLFEIGKSHIFNEPDPNEPGVPKEANALSLVYASKLTDPASYYLAQKYLKSVLYQFQALTAVKFEPLAGADLGHNPWLEQMVAPFEPNRSAVLRDTEGLVWGVVGEFRRSVQKSLKLPLACAGFELDPLLLARQLPHSQYRPLSRYPKVEQDICLKVSATTAYQQIFDFVGKKLDELKPDHSLIQLNPVDIYQRGDDKTHLQITLRLIIASYDRTLTDVEVNSLLDKVAEAAKSELSAERL